MNYEESTILATVHNSGESIENTYRLIETPVSDGAVYSVFLTTRTEADTDECFVYDIARREGDARGFLKRVQDGNVTACTLRDVARDFVLEALILP